MQRNEKKSIIVPREKDRDVYHLLSERDKERRRSYGLDDDRLLEMIEPENLEKFKQVVEEEYQRDFSEVMTDAVELKFDVSELSRLMYLFANVINGGETDEEAFSESCARVSPFFITEALGTVKAAVESGGKEPVVWRIDILCKR